MALTTTTAVQSTQMENPFLKKVAEGGLGPAGIDYEALNRRIQQVAGMVRSPIIPDLRAAGVAPSRQEMVTDPQKRAAYEGVTGQAESLRRQGEMQATALEMKGAQTIQGMQRMDETLARLRGENVRAGAAWDKMVETADEYVKTSNQRMAAVMDKLDTAIGEVGKNLGFAKTQALQTQVAGAVSEMNTQEREIAAMYGRDSAEFAQFRQSKARSMQVAVSNIHAQYDQFAAQLGGQMALGRAQAGEAMATLVNWQEKGHVEALQAAAGARDLYGMKEAELALQIEQLKALGMEDLTQTLAGATVLRLDLLPFVEYLTELGQQKMSSTMMGSVPAKWSQGMRAPSSSSTAGTQQRR